MSFTDTPTMTIEQALRADVWDQSFWDALTGAEKTARVAVDHRWDEAMENGNACTCSTCVVHLVLEAVWPTLTEQVLRIKDGPACQSETSKE